MNKVKPMKTYTGAQWTLISLATHYGMDKDVFDDRLVWGRKVLLCLKKAKTWEDYKLIIAPYIAEADVPEEFAACAISVWDIIQNEPSNYVVGLDACNSGKIICPFK